jgi:hypothetical protein
VDCQEWSPKGLASCPDCSGTLAPEPAWAEIDPVLAKLDYLARYGVRKGDRDDWGNQRRRYNAVRARLLPVLAAEEAARSERYAAVAQAAGVPTEEYRASVERDRRERVRAREQLDKARGAGHITQEEWERASHALVAQWAEAEAAAQGLSLSAFEAARRRTAKATKRAYGDEDPDAFSDRLGKVAVVIGGGCLTAVVVLVLATAFLVARCSA